MTTPTSTPGTIAASYFAARPNDGATYDAAADFRALMARCDDLQTQLDATTVAGDRILRQWKAASERGHAKLAESEAHAERLAAALDKLADIAPAYSAGRMQVIIAEALAAWKERGK